MIPDDSKVKAVQEWPRPTQVSEVRQFLGLASYYRRYIENFSDIAAPLTHLTQKGVPFIWNKNCEDAFCGLKTRLTQAPVLAYPKLGPEASPFILQTDASAVGLGAVLEQDKRVIAYASRTLTKSGCITASLHQAHRLRCPLDVSQHITERKWKGNLRKCSSKESLKKVAAHGWHQLYSYPRNQERFVFALIIGS